MENQAINQFMQIVKSRRSCRNFKSDPLPEGAIDKILEAARWAMSGGNGQPWEFIVVTRPQLKQQLWEAYREMDSDYTFWMEQLRERELRHPSFQKPGTIEAQLAAYDTQKGFANAPALIVVLGDGRKQWASVMGGLTYGRSHNHFTDGIANACQIIHLAAAAMGLGSQWVTIHVSENFKRILGVPDLLTLHSIIPIGYPAGQPKCGRQPLDRMVHAETYDMTKYRTNRQIVEDLAKRRKETVSSYQTTY